MANYTVEQLIKQLKKYPKQTIIHVNGSKHIQVRYSRYSEELNIRRCLEEREAIVTDRLIVLLNELKSTLSKQKYGNILFEMDILSGYLQEFRGKSYAHRTDNTA